MALVSRALGVAALMLCLLTASAAWAVSGVVYDGASFQPISGVQIFLVDDATGVLVPREQLGPGQQGQRTPITGQYQFDTPAGVFRLDVRAPDGYQFPAKKLPYGA